MQAEGTHCFLAVENCDLGAPKPGEDLGGVPVLGFWSGHSGIMAFGVLDVVDVMSAGYGLDAVPQC
jgi:hypothetical protein